MKDALHDVVDQGDAVPHALPIVGDGARLGCGFLFEKRGPVRACRRRDSGHPRPRLPAQGENAGMIQQSGCWMNAGHFNRSPAPSVITAAGWWCPII